MPEHWIRAKNAAPIAMILLCMANCADAQYYDQPRSYTPGEARYLSGGFFAREFTPRSGNSTPDSLAISYKRFMPLIGFHQGPVEIAFGYTTFDLRGATRSAIFLGLTYTSDHVIVGTRENALLLPILIAADFTKSGGAGSLRDQFNVGSLGVGTGLKYRVQGASIDFAFTGAALIHYSFEGYSIQSGSSTALVAEAVALLKTVPVFDGIALGYRFRLQNWTLDNGRFDYRTVNHGIFVGVLF